MFKKRFKFDINQVSQMVYASALIMMFERGENMVTGVLLFTLTWIVSLLTTNIPEGLNVVDEVLEYIAAFFNGLYLAFWAAGIVEIALGKYVLGGVILLLALVMLIVKRFFPRKED